MPKLDRLTLVHDGDSGLVGGLVLEMRGSFRFAIEGSGLIDVGGNAGPTAQRGSELPTITVPIAPLIQSRLTPEAVAVVNDDVPCIIGHSGEQVALLVPSKSLARVTGGLSDLRGKIKFGLARVGWDL